MRKIRYKRLAIFLVFVLLLGLIGLKVLSLRISNIYVSGNVYLSEQKVIELGKISNYPRTFFRLSSFIESSIEKSDYVKSASVKKKGLTKVYITIEENRPLYFDQASNKTILMDGSSVSDKIDVPSLVTPVSEEIYSSFLSQLSLIDLPVLNYISEIEYTPNSVDSKLFLFTMNDGNYIYVNLDRFESVNKYFDMVVKFNNHKGILYLDSGEYFKILEN
jgi:cell division septal protein FtsQ